MITIKQYNSQLNKSYDFKTHFIKWGEYRQTINNKFIDYIDKSDNCLVVGAGFLNDIEIKNILDKVKKTTLLDIDIEAIKKGLKNQDINEKEISILEKDITGLDKDEFFEKIIYMLQVNDLKGITRYFNDVAARPIKLQLSEQFDCIIISSIYTQILLPQYTFLLQEIIKEEKNNEYLEPFMYFISKMIRNINESLIENIKEGGKIVCFSDILQFSSEDKKLKELSLKTDSYKYIENYYINYVKKYGKGLGDFGILDMSSYITIEDSSWHIWPYDSNKTLLVKLIIGVKKKT